MNQNIIEMYNFFRNNIIILSIDLYKLHITLYLKRLSLKILLLHPKLIKIIKNFNFYNITFVYAIMFNKPMSIFLAKKESY